LVLFASKLALHIGKYVYHNSSSVPIYVVKMAMQMQIHRREWSITSEGDESNDGI